MMPDSVSSSELHYEGVNFLRQRLVLSCVSGKKVKITNIRSNEENPGVRDFEISLIRLFDQLSNGAKIQVGRSGTSFTFIPGVLLGGNITHTCDPARGIGYYLEPVMMLAPFCKRPLQITLKGITNCEGDVSVDQLRYSLLEVLHKFLGTDDQLRLVVVKRGLPPVPCGVVEFSCPVRKQLMPFQWLDSGLVKKVRGLCFTRRVAPVVANRIMESAKRHLNQYLPDVYFVCDNAKGPAPGFGIAINCVTTKGTYYSSEALSCQQCDPSSVKDVLLAPLHTGSATTDSSTANGVASRILSPEEVGEEAVFRLLEEVRRGGCVGSHSQALVLLFMVLSPKDVSKAVFGPLTTQAIYMLKHIRDFFSVTFKLDEYRHDEDSDEGDDEDGDQKRRTGASKVVLTCVGTGFVNFSKGNI